MTTNSGLSFKQRLCAYASTKQFWLTAIALVAVVVLAYSFYGVNVKARVDRSEQITGCPPSTPILITVHNNTFHRLARVRIALEGWRGGRSENILAHRWFNFNIVTGSFRTSRQCLSDDAFSIDLPESIAPARKENLKESPEERHARLQKMADDIEKEKELAEIIFNPSSTEYEKLDALDRKIGLMDEVFHPVEEAPSLKGHDAKDEDVRFDFADVIAGVNELERLTRGVTLVVKEIDPEFY